MKLILPLAVLATLALAGCGEREASHGEKADANNNAAQQAEKSFDKENPADPAAMQPAPAPK